MANRRNLSHADIAKLIEASDSEEEVLEYENHISDEIDSESSDNDFDTDIQQMNYKGSIQSKNRGFRENSQTNCTNSPFFFFTSINTLQSSGENVLESLAMGAVICTSGKTASREHSSGRQSGKSLRRKITKDSIYDSSDYVECSSLIRTNGKERLQFTSKHEIHANIPTQLEPKEYKIKPCGIANCNCSLCQKIDNSSKCAPTQRLFKNVWGRKHKTYSSDSTLSATKNSSDIPNNSTSTTACLDHLTTHLSLNEKCGLCDFVESGKHDRWNSLEEDANLFREVSKNITKWLRTTPKCMKRIVLHSVEPEQKIRITLWKDKAGVQEILVTDGDQPCQIKGI
ncbi:hypothetical protein HNY73_010429 [Argiope bruennichi]|uniref:Uncharacterized protein n=1 Tax=Argiope bruennichi TaxID=94029 RepID=A0A8T0F3B6_ARGBR|nr:hypothetical protein HNY73_010429 [Argiope bruennichi]